MGILVSQVHFILNELVMGGMVLETNMTEILSRIEEQNKLEKEEVGGSDSFFGSRTCFSCFGPFLKWSSVALLNIPTVFHTARWFHSYLDLPDLIDDDDDASHIKVELDSAH